MNRSTVISVLFLVIHAAFAKDANERALDIDGGRELKGKSSGSKSGKSRRNLDVNGAHVLDGNRELKGSGSKSGKSSGSKSGKSRRALELHESELEFEDIDLDELEFEGLLP